MPAREDLAVLERLAANAGADIKDDRVIATEQVTHDLMMIVPPVELVTNMVERGLN